MYTVNGAKFDSFFKAIAAAKEVNAQVLNESGEARWTPAEKVSDKKMRVYKERLAAYSAQQQMRAA